MNGHPGYAYARQGARRGALIGGLGLGAVGAALGGLPKTQYNLATGQKEERTKAQRITGAVLGGLSFGTYGALEGHGMGWNRNANKWNAGNAGAHSYGSAGGYASGARAAAPPASTPEWLQGAQTRAEGRKRFHQQARKYHPDLGGDPEVFKRISAEWEAHEPHFKQAMINAFADELVKIANAGTYVGGAAGYMMGGNSIKSKALSTLGGAVVGTGVGSAVGAVKRSFHDEPKAWEQQQLYGYMPSQNPEYGSPTRF